MVRIIAWIFRFVDTASNKGASSLTGTLRGEKAKKFMLKVVQREGFSGELDKKNCVLKPFCDDFDLLRLKTRVSNTPDDLNFCFPVVLESKHIVLERLIFDEHVRSSHVGTQELLSILQEKYWILEGRRIVLFLVRALLKTKL